MKYMLLIYSDEKIWTEQERADCMAESALLCQELSARGKFLAASPLHSVTTAKSLRVREGKPLVTDGPFAETYEQLGGYFILDLESWEEALEVAQKIPGVKRGTVEIRPVFELAGLPS